MTKHRKNVHDKNITIRKRLPSGTDFPMTIPNPDYEPPAPPKVATAELSGVSITASTFQTSSMAANLPPMKDRLKAVQEAYAWIGPEKIIVLNDDPMMETAGGIAIPDAALQRPTSGTIAMLGDEVEAKTRGAQAVGKRIIYAVYAGTAIDFRGWNMRVMKWTEAEVVLADGVEDAFKGVVK